MPRPKLKQASTRFHAAAYPLTDADKVKLVRLLGYSSLDADEETMRHQYPGYGVILEVENTLGIYIHGAAHLDNIPRPADYRQAFRPVGRAALALHKTLSGWTEYYRDQFKVKGADIQAIESALASLVDVSAAVVRDSRGKSSKGRPRTTALAEIIRRLRRIFRDNYCGPRSKRTLRKAFRHLADWERAELDFVRTALDAPKTPRGIARIRYQNLSALFREPRCTPSEDRDGKN